MSGGLCWAVERHGTVGSTMEVAAERALAGAAEGTVIFADGQTAGRGRAGRRWQTPAGTALLVTAILRPAVAPDRLSTLALVAAVAVAEAIEAETGLPVWLKWPNDLWLGERDAGLKVGGILVSARLGQRCVEHALVGIGVNVSSTAAELPTGATSIAVALPDADARSRASSRADFRLDAAPASANDDRRLALLQRLLTVLGEGYGAFVAADGRPSLTPWLNRAALLGESVEVDVGGEPRRGVFVGVRDDGALLLRGRDGREEAIVAGDLVRGPRYALEPGQGPGGPVADRRRAET